jgi:hypothetical protein
MRVQTQTPMQTECCKSTRIHPGWAIALVALSACTRTSADTTVDASAEAGFDPTGRVPRIHRPSGTACTPAPLPPEPQPIQATLPDGGTATFGCAKHADCTSKPNGRCVYRPSHPSYPSGNVCLYEDCLTDTDCANGGVCQCAGDEASLCSAGCNCPDHAPSCTVQQDFACSCGNANLCVLGTQPSAKNCRVDADCGPGRYCSPGFNGCGELAGWFCHTPDDTCFDHTDCPGGGPCYPPFAADARGWRCGQAECGP